MKNSHPSNVVIGIFVSILLIIAVFMIGVLINHLSKDVSDSDEGLEEPEQELVN